MTLPGWKYIRDNILIGNVSGATTYADSNLSSSTKYSYTLIPYTVNGLEGKAVSISLTTASPSSGSGGGEEAVPARLAVVVEAAVQAVLKTLQMW